MWQVVEAALQNKEASEVVNAFLEVRQAVAEAPCSLVRFVKPDCLSGRVIGGFKGRPESGARFSCHAVAHQGPPDLQSMRQGHDA